MDMITISPEHPTTATPVTISIVWSGCIKDEGIEKNGHTFHLWIDYSNLCWAAAPGGTAHIEVGTLDVGSYAVIYEWSTEGVHDATWTETFAVTAASGTAVPVPTIGVAAACMLAATIFIAAFVANSRLAANISLQRTSRTSRFLPTQKVRRPSGR